MAVVGRIARAHGIRGQVIVNAETDFPDERFQPGAELFIERGGTIELRYADPGDLLRIADLLLGETS